MKSVKRKVFSIIVIIAILIGICAASTVYAMGNNFVGEDTDGYVASTTQNGDNIVSEDIETKPTGVTDNVSTTPAQTNNTKTQSDDVEMSENADNSNHDLGLLAAALATGLSCIGAGIAVAMVASSAIGAISENPKLLGKTIIFAGLAEGIAIYGLIISIMILNKI